MRPKLYQTDRSPQMADKYRPVKKEKYKILSLFSSDQKQWNSPTVKKSFWLLKIVMHCHSSMACCVFRVQKGSTLK
jgi:hypothetical protein